MRRYALICLVAATGLFLLLTGTGICQDAAKPAEAPPAKAEPAANVESKEEAIYGEVMAVNEAGSSMTVQYYDYDADEEKDLEIMVGQATKLENAASLKDIKKGDWVDVTYAPGEGKKTAKSVKVEKAEEPEAPEGTAADESPEE